jgi:hypothetical protein
VVESTPDLRIIVDVATKVPNLDFLGCKVGGYERGPFYSDKIAEHYERDWKGLRRDSRHDFASTISSCISQLPKSLTRASLDFMNPFNDVVMIYHDRKLPDLVSPVFPRTKR